MSSTHKEHSEVPQEVKDKPLEAIQQPSNAEIVQKNEQKPVAANEKIQQSKEIKEQSTKTNQAKNEQKKEESQNNVVQSQPQNQQQNHAVQEDNESNWTDATQSIRADDEDDIWVVDDDIINAMEIDSGEEEVEQGDEQDEDQDEEGQSAQKQGEKIKKKKKDDVDFEELEHQFVKGGQSEENWRLGFHQKFCTSVAVAPDGKAVFTGGGDDTLLCFRQNEGKWQQFYRLKHGETVSKVEVSHDGKYVVSFAQTEIFCTQLSKLQTKKLGIQQPADVVCHKQGGVLAAAYGYTVGIYNLKGLDLYTSYNLDLPPNTISFTDNGKQIIAACQNKLRLITPKTGQIVKAVGNDFHKDEISAFASNATVVASGCIGGTVFVTNLAKGNIFGSFEPFKGAINYLSFADNYLLVAPQGDGVYWCDVNKLKNFFHSPEAISVSSIVNVHSPHNYAISDLEGNIHLLDRRAPMTIIGKKKAGNSIHALESKGSNLYAACEDGYVRVFDVSSLL